MSLTSVRKKSYNYCDLSHVMFHFSPLFSSSTLTGLEFWGMLLLVKWKKFILCSHIGLNNHVAYPSWIWYIWNDFVLIICTNEMARLSYSKEPSLSLLCTHYANGKRRVLKICCSWIYHWITSVDLCLQTWEN